MKHRFIHLAVAVSGAAVLAVEILGTRILGPFYGVSLFLWSALIAVTLAALAAGYAVGGRWADRSPSRARFALLMVAAGAWLFALPVLRGPVIAAARPLGLRAAMLAASIMLFFPPLVVLGMVTPYAVKLRARSLAEVGRAAGDLYAVSTLASVAAVLLTGFVLIPGFGVGQLTAAIGVVLLASGLVCLPWRARETFTAAVAGEVVDPGAPGGGRAGERSSQPGAAAPPWFVYLAVVVNGGGILAVEILGARLLAPFYGSGLYLWSALIGVALLALSLGYLLGGRWSERGPQIGRFCALLGVGGVLVAAIPWLRSPILAATEPLGLRAAVLVAALVLFFPPLAVMGMVSPYAVRLRTASLGVVGTMAGRLYALSTLASVAAALGTGLVLIPAVGAGRLAFLIGAALIVTALVGAARTAWDGPAGRRGALPAAILIVLAAVAAAFVTVPGARVDPEAGLLAIEHSPYGEIRVVEVADLRMMLIDGMVHSEADALTLEPRSPYGDVLEMGGGFFRAPGRMLLVGLGAGGLAKIYTRAGWSVDAVEIDPAVTRTAARHFGFEPEHARVYHMDGREFLMRSDEQYDLIIIDAFGGSSIPFHLVTREAFALFASRLAPRGVLAMNVIAVGWRDVLVRSLAATLGQEFARVLVLPMAEPPDQLGNLILIAGNRELELVEELPVPEERFSADYHRAHAWDNRFEIDPLSERAITDDRNPVDLWAERINLATRKELHEYFGARGIGW